MALKKAKHELESKIKDQEEELDDQAGQIQQLEQVGAGCNAVNSCVMFKIFMCHMINSSMQLLY